MSRLLLLGYLALAAACATTMTSPAASPALGAPFQLQRGQTAAIAGQPLTVRFTRVVEDSRCPVGTQCIREGNAQVELEMRTPGRELEHVIANTQSNLPHYASFVDYDVHLDSLRPEPRPGDGRRDYVAFLRVTKH